MVHSLKIPGRKLTCMATAHDESPVARIEPDGQCGEGPQRNWMPLVDDCRCTVSAMDKLLHASNRLPHNRHPAVQVVGVNHATLHRTVSQLQRRIATVDEVAIDVNAVCVQRQFGKLPTRES